MADRFYTPHELTPGEYTLEGAEAHHLAAVRRFSPGDSVTLFNGDGRDYPCAILSVGKRAVVLQVAPAVEASRELVAPVVVGVALPKGDRGDFLVEKLTELGVTTLVPLITERSVVKPGDAKAEKLARAVIEASKQCGRNRLMAVEPAAKWGAFLGRADLPASRFVPHTGPGLPPLPCGLPPGGAALAVGPEGGFSPGEVAAALAAGWTAVSLGPRTLRVETAAVAAVARVSSESRLS